jgi:hypothetical protein
MARRTPDEWDDAAPGKPDELIIEPGFRGWFQENWQAISVLWLVLLYATLMLYFLSLTSVWGARVLSNALLAVFVAQVAVAAIVLRVRVHTSEAVRRTRRVERIEVRVVVGLWTAIGLAVLAIVAHNLHWWPMR